VSSSRSTAVRGGLLAVGAFTFWGLAPLYFRPLRHVDPLEVLAHRVTWSVVFLVVVAAAMRRGPEILRVLRAPRVVLALMLSAALICVNWGLFILAVSRQEVLQASLGYFLNPLLNVMLGVLVLGERLRRAQAAAVIIAGASVVALAVHVRGVPVIALLLAVTFAAYGLVRKLIPVDALTGLLVETLLLLPAAVILLVTRERVGTAAFGGGGMTDALLLLAGAWTAIPLLLFVGAARRLTLTSLGFFQYIAPTLQFLLAVLAWHESFGLARLLAFCGTWLALAIVSVDAALVARRNRARA
jgi:chloramphenicol-sensitive protein RarD